MQLCLALLCSFSLVVVAACNGVEQVYIDSGKNSYNLTLKFDDLPTNDSGIGYDPTTNSTPLHYSDLYFQSFTVVDVVKARDQLPDPVDLFCANSAPNALFSRRRSGFPWPRFSLHSLTDPSLPRDPNVTFTMQSVSISPTGSIPQDGLVLVWLNLLKLPPDEFLHDGGQNPPFPELFRGAPIRPEGRVYQLVAFFGPGPHISVRVDWDGFRRSFPDMATKVDTFEVYGELLQRKGSNEPYGVVGDWEVCLDDVAVEVVRKTRQDENEEARDMPMRMFLFAGDDGEMIADQGRGERLMKDLGL